MIEECEDFKDYILDQLILEDKIVLLTKDYKIKICDLYYSKTLDLLDINDMYISHLSIYNNILIICGKKITLYDMINYQIITIIDIHDKHILKSLIWNDNLITCSTDHTIKITNLKTYICSHSLEQHTNWVRDILIYKDLYLISCSDDNTIKFWNLDTFELVKTIEGHTNWIIKIILYKNKLISFSDDKTFNVWNLDTFAVEKSVNFSFWFRNIILVDNILYFSVYNIIYIYNLDTYKYTLLINGTCIRSVFVYKNLILFSDCDDNLIIHNLSNQERYSYKCNTFLLYLSHRGYLYTSSKILVYMPLYNIYQDSIFKVKVIMNKRFISLRKKIYKGKMYLRDIKKLNQSYDSYINYKMNERL